MWLVVGDKIKGTGATGATGGTHTQNPPCFIGQILDMATKYWKGTMLLKCSQRKRAVHPRRLPEAIPGDARLPAGEEGGGGDGVMG